MRVRAGNELDFGGGLCVHACITDRNYRKWCSLDDVQTLEFSKLDMTEKSVVQNMYRDHNQS